MKRLDAIVIAFCVLYVAGAVTSREMHRPTWVNVTEAICWIMLAGAAALLLWRAVRRVRGIK